MRLQRTRWWGVFLAILLGGSVGRAQDGLLESNRLRDDHAPCPYSAAEIRRDCGAGAWRTARMEMKSPTGWSQSVQRTRFFDSDADSTVFEAVQLGDDGAPQGEASIGRAAWTDLQQHASFPEHATFVETVPVHLEAGTFTSWLYVVQTAEGEKRLWFAHDLAGPPILMEEWRGGERVFRMTLLSYGTGETAAGR